MRATEKLAAAASKPRFVVAYAEGELAKRRAAYAKSSLRQEWSHIQQGIEIGTVEDKELLEPAKAYALGRFNTMNATMELDLALAKLARATGWDVIAPDGTSAP